MDNKPPGTALKHRSRQVLHVAILCLAVAVTRAARSDRPGDVAARPASYQSTVTRIDVRAALRSSLLVLPVSRDTLDAAPRFYSSTQSQAVDAYWAAHPPLVMN